MEVLLRIIAVAFVASLIPLIVVLVRAHGRFSGRRSIFCPIGKRTVQVRFDAGHAAWTSVMGETDLRVASCSEWPARKDCAAECLADVEVAASGALVAARSHTAA